MATIQEIYNCLQEHRPNFKDIPINVSVIPCRCGVRVEVEGNEFPGDAHRRHVATMLISVVEEANGN